MEYTGDQLTAIDIAESGIQSRRPLTRIAGFAGTGKTTIMKEVYRRCPNSAIAAFMGKACDVLRRKGLPGQTIHSLIYKFNSITNRFVLVDNLKDVDWIGVDEGSMVGTRLWRDLVSFKKPILVIGDPGQLEPVADEDPGLMKNPDFTLTEIHRQAEDNPIIKLSMEIRSGDHVDWGKFGRPISYLGNDEDLLWPDMIVCGFNKTRVNLNKAIRKLKAYSHKFEEGERLICRQNDYDLGVFNGQTFTVSKVLEIGSDYSILTLKADGGDTYEDIKVSHLSLNSLTKLSWSKTRHLTGKIMVADYANVITCHGAQGSEYDRVAYIDEQCDKWCPIRHRYTGTTRAAQDLRVYTSEF